MSNLNDLRVNVAGLDFFGDDFGPFVIEPNGWTGWDGGVDMRFEKVARPGAHGSFRLPSFQDSRLISISGNILADSPQKLEYLKNRITGILAGGQSGRIQVSRPWGTTWADCQLVKTVVTERGSDSSATFQMQLWCPDPRKFGDLQKFTMPAGATAQVFHRGNYAATPYITVTGSMPGYTLTINGANYAVSVPLVSGTPHVINYNDGHLRINGSIVQNSIGNTNLTTIPPGTVVACALYATSGGTGTAVLDLLDTYT